MQTPSTVKDRIKAQWAKMIALVSIVAIALGGLNDTIDALEKVYNITLSKFTDIPSQSKLEKIYIRGAADKLDETFGAPVYIKLSYSGDVIKYYLDSHFIISSISQDGFIAAYLVFPKQGFTPNTFEHAGGKDLLTMPLSHLESVSEYRSVTSRSLTYYIEASPTGKFSNLYVSISGYSEILGQIDRSTREQINKLGEELILDIPSTQTVTKLREKLTPNFYGYSTISVVDLEQAILTKSEYQLITRSTQ
ncbi:hypothetical protein EGH82_22980 [Vibrio ponticus]|uniref:Uncharacterized protein n=2 Tax=Vibrio ponticus TaxID=265668 RepID=A0A3N3DTD9_9VIBR|nr:hypothetical protein EGH82_22980 [Vibrio ponticus]